MSDLIVEVEREIRVELQRYFNDDRVNIIAEAITERVRKHCGGTDHYVRVSKISTRKRNASIVREWNEQREKKGRADCNAIARKHEVHPATVRRVITKYLNRPRTADGFGGSDWEL